MNISEENKHQTKNEIIYKSSTFKKMFEKMPLDKDEYPKKIPNDIKIFYFSTNDKIKNTILKENQGKDNIVFNKSYELNNYLKLNNTHQQTLKKKFVVMNMIKNKIESDRNNTLKRIVNKLLFICWFINYSNSHISYLYFLFNIYLIIYLFILFLI